MTEKERLERGAIRDYYNRVYHRDAGVEAKVSHHLRRLAWHFQPWQGKRLLDVGCGSGTWLRAVADLGAVPAGVDISQVALAACKQALPSADLYCGPAESLPFTEGEFDFISCLGALEHFLEPQAALREMIRVAKPGALSCCSCRTPAFLPGDWVFTRALNKRVFVRRCDRCGAGRSCSNPSGSASAGAGGICTCCRRRGFFAGHVTVGCFVPVKG
jgi:ubiquinone/menaquinone biosynthesis C-methylase UbiE